MFGEVTNDESFYCVVFCSLFGLKHFPRKPWALSRILWLPYIRYKKKGRFPLIDHIKEDASTEEEG